MNTNNIQNILSMLDVAKLLHNPGSLVKDFRKLKIKPSTCARGAQDMWLKYRYVYNTSISDIEEITRYCTQLAGDRLIFRSKAKEGIGTMTCKVITELSDDLSAFGRLQKYGVAPDLYNIWDMVPYSFVVDWFTDIGSILESISNRQWALHYKVQSVTLSWKWRTLLPTDLGLVPFVHYERFVTPELPPYIPYVRNHVGTRTILFRVLDGISLFVGR